MRRHLLHRAASERRQKKFAKGTCSNIERCLRSRALEIPPNPRSSGVRAVRNILGCTSSDTVDSSACRLFSALTKRPALTSCSSRGCALRRALVICWQTPAKRTYSDLESLTRRQVQTRAVVASGSASGKHARLSDADRSIRRRILFSVKWTRKSTHCAPPASEARDAPACGPAGVMPACHDECPAKRAAWNLHPQLLQC